MSMGSLLAFIAGFMVVRLLTGRQCLSTSPQ